MAGQLEKSMVTSFSWVDVLEQTKAAQNSIEDLESFLSIIRPEYQPWYDQISAYAAEMSIERGDSTLSSAERKDLVVQTRAALRFGLCCLSTPKKPVVSIIQVLAVAESHWHVPILALLSRRRCDSKCRTFASRLLSNLVTGNMQTAVKVSSDVALAPPQSYVNSSIRDSITKADDASVVDEGERADDRIGAAKAPDPNWVDMILWCAKSENREALAAIAAALHNCIASLVDYDEERSAIRCEYAESVASNGMLISTLLRNFVSTQELQKSIANEKRSSEDASKEKADHWDSATDWIQLLLSKLSSLGLLPEMYSCIWGKQGSDQSSTRKWVQVLPEQNVLLHCMAREADSFVVAFGSNCQIKNPFGEECGLEVTFSTYSFLCDVFVDFSSCLHPPQSKKDSGEEDCIFETTLLSSGLVTVADILASTLGVDNSLNTALRLHLADRTVVLQETAKTLGTMLDNLAEKCEGRRARDIHLEHDAQKLLIAFVRLIGNLCFRCPQNQDLLRTTLVPQTTPSQQGKMQDIPGPHEPCDESGDHDSSHRGGGAEPRNGLHVLLSCTTYATSCFTLREWTVIAIRNALEDNTGNQDLVGELVAQDPVQTADLENAGIRVQLDSKGNVSLKKLDSQRVPVVQEEDEGANDQGGRL
jgi:hypothetical protein